jgi:CBS domain-containing protein
MRIADVMTTDVITVRPETPLREVASLLAADRISGVPVVDAAGTLLGVVSEADILYKERRRDDPRGVVARVLGPVSPEDSLKLEARTAVEAMTAPALTVRQDATVSAAAGVMLDEGVNRLPVVARDGSLIGIVTRADLVRAFARPDDALEREIRDEVLRDALWIDPDRLDVSIDRGEVKLEGRVDSSAQADAVERFVRLVPGIVSVDVQLTW